MSKSLSNCCRTDPSAQSSLSDFAQNIPAPPTSAPTTAQYFARDTSDFRPRIPGSIYASAFPHASSQQGCSRTESPLSIRLTDPERLDVRGAALRHRNIFAGNRENYVPDLLRTGPQPALRHPTLGILAIDPPTPVHHVRVCGYIRLFTHQDPVQQHPLRRRVSRQGQTDRRIQAQGFLHAGHEISELAFFVVARDGGEGGLGDFGAEGRVGGWVGKDEVEERGDEGGSRVLCADGE